MNLTLLTDLYQLTMMQGYYAIGNMEKKVVFDLYYRENPFGGAYSIACGLEQVIEYIKALHFSEEDIAYLKTLGRFSDEFLEFLKQFKFTGDIHAVPEGTVVFPNEPLIRVKAPIIQAQLIETALLNIINHQSLIATKAARVMWAAQGDTVMEFGLRRAQGPDAGIYGARAAIIAGCNFTSNVLAGKLFNVPIVGTHAHSWVMSFPDELTAFREYVKIFPNSAILLVDTYSTLKSGVKNAILVFKEMEQQGIPMNNIGIRLDSGDLAYLSKKARKMLDDAGFKNASICASSDLDENLISELKLQGAKITVWGIGTRLITSKDCPAFGGVYKLVAEEDENGSMNPKIKISENPIKVTNPGVKKLIRLYDKSTNKIKADLIALEEEIIDETKPLKIFDPNATWKTMTLCAGEYYTKQLLKPIFINGECVYNIPSVMEIKEYCKSELSTLWDEHKRLVKPQLMYVDLSQKLYDLKQTMINDTMTKVQ